MAPVVIANPILNSPFEEPAHHFRFGDDGITDEIVEERRLAGYFVPVPQPRKKGKQLVLDTEWTQDRFKEAEFINRVRARVKIWRQQGLDRARPLVPAVNNEGSFGRWAFLEVLDPWKCEQQIRDLVLAPWEDGGDGSKAPAAGAVA